MIISIISSVNVKTGKPVNKSADDIKSFYRPLAGKRIVSCRIIYGLNRRLV